MKIKGGRKVKKLVKTQTDEKNANVFKLCKNTLMIGGMQNKAT